MLSTYVDKPGPRRIQTRPMLIGLFSINVATWLWASSAFANRPDLIGAALLAYSLGLRHAFDADHVAAIDNVVRKLQPMRRHTETVGLFFSLGHSTVVVLASAAVASAAGRTLERWHEIGGTIGTFASIGFLFAIAIANIATLRDLVVAHARTRRGGGEAVPELVDPVLTGGVVMRLLGPLATAISRPWQMYPMGFLFGLGFDTATEVALIGVAATQSAEGLSIWHVMVFPALFTAGMSLMDTADSVIMTRAYGWALVDPIRRLRYNIVMTAISIAVALLVGGIEGLALVGDRLKLHGAVWRVVGRLSDHFPILGLAITTFLALAWLTVAKVSRWRAARLRVAR